MRVQTLLNHCHPIKSFVYTDYDSPYWAKWYLDKWCNRAMRSRLEPIKKFVKTLRAHQPLIMN